MKDAISAATKAVKYLLIVMVLAVPFALSTSVPEAQAEETYEWWWGLKTNFGCPSGFEGWCYTQTGTDCLAAGSTGCHILDN